jgi:hypothetical protein
MNSFLLALLLTATALAQIPSIRKNGQAAHLYVDGKPYLMLAGELHNSSASSIEYMKPIWDHLAAMGVNTVIGTVSWELLEPEEGRFDFSLVDAQIHEAQKRNMKLVLIWFATWKNANSTYAPMWVKTDQKRFPRMVIKDRPDLKNKLSGFFAEQMPLPNLTPFGPATIDADARAFRILMRHIREVDNRQTVIMMQPENEVGLLGDSRDRSPMAEAAWAGPVPAELMNYLTRNKSTLLPEMQEVWGRNGYKASGTWAQVFGSDNWADEVFMAWHVGRFLGRVIEAGKAEHPIPMYVNAWLGPQPGMEQPGMYPSGGPVARLLDVWRVAAPQADLLAPDIYVEDFKGTCAIYARSGNPLFIPEARASVGNLFWSIGRHSAMGFSPFGIEDVPVKSQYSDAYRALAEMRELIATKQAEGKMTAVLLEDDKPVVTHFAGYRLTVRPSTAKVQLDAGQTAPDSNMPPPPGYVLPPDRRPHALILATGPDEFVIVGSGVLAHFAADSPGPTITEIGWIEEGRFEKERWVPGRRLNGDEGRPFLRGGELGMIKLKLYRRN